MQAGKGLRSNPRLGGVLTDAARELLRRQGLRHSAATPGQLRISGRNMVAWTAAVRRHERRAEVRKKCGRCTGKPMVVFLFSLHFPSPLLGISRP